MTRAGTGACMISRRQLEANRRNALKATGPKTPGGKAVASLNSLRHGLSSAYAFTSQEDQRLFDERFTVFADHYQPDGPFETLLVANLTVATLRLDRVVRMETEFFNRGLARQPEHLHNLPGSERKALVFLEDACGPNRLAKLSRYPARAEDDFYRALHELERLQAARAQGSITERNHSQNRTPVTPGHPPKKPGDTPARC